MATSRISITGVLAGMLTGVFVVVLIVAGIVLLIPQPGTQEVQPTPDTIAVEGVGRISHGSLTVEVNDNPDMTIRFSAPELPADAWDHIDQTVDSMIISAPVEVTTAEPLTGTVTLTRTYPVAVPDEAHASFGYFDEELDMWLPVTSTLSEDRTILTATVEHLSTWTDFISGTTQTMGAMSDTWNQTTGAVLHSGGELLRTGTQLLADGSYYVVAQISDSYAPRPECTGSVPVWADPEITMLDDAVANPLRWCVGSDPDDSDVLMVKISNNRGYPVTVGSSIPARSAVSDGMDMGMVETLFQSLDIYGNMASSMEDLLLLDEFILTPKGSATFFFNKPDSPLEPIVVETTPAPFAVSVGTIAVRQVLSEVTGFLMEETQFPVEDEALFAAAQCIYAGGRAMVGTGTELEFARECVTGVLLTLAEQNFLNAGKIAKIAGRTVSLASFGWSTHQHVFDARLPDIVRKLQVYMNVTEFSVVRDQDTDEPVSTTPTEKSYIAPVDRQLILQDGWQQSGSIEQVSGYCSPTGVAEGQDIYTCGSTAQSLEACFFSSDSPTQGICLTDPFSREYRSIIFTGEKLNDQVTESYAWGLVLDDGRECTARRGGAWGSRADGGIGTYHCGSGSHEVGLVLPGDGTIRGIDMSNPKWTLQMGEQGDVGEDFPPPRKVGITAAYFVSWVD